MCAPKIPACRLAASWTEKAIFTPHRVHVPFSKPSKMQSCHTKVYPASAALLFRCTVLPLLRILWQRRICPSDDAGVAYCQLLDSVLPGKVPLHKLNFNAQFFEVRADQRIPACFIVFISMTGCISVFKYFTRYHGLLLCTCWGNCGDNLCVWMVQKPSKLNLMLNSWSYSLSPWHDRHTDGKDVHACCALDKNCIWHDLHVLCRYFGPGCDLRI